MAAGGDVPSNPEVHNVVEAIIGAEYGLDVAIWWDAVELARAAFVNANKADRLAYAEHRDHWTTAAIYRAPDGAIQGFLGSSERMAYRFVSLDRAVFFNGLGPRREFTVTVPQHREIFFNITWGEDVQPPVDGQYVLVNRDSRRWMEVGNGSTADSANIQQNTYRGEPHQQWDVRPFSSPWLDQSFFTITPGHSEKTADMAGWSVDNGGNLHQWESLSAENQLWYLKYVEDGCFHIRNRWSGKFLEVTDGSTADGANFRQWDFVSAGGRNPGPSPRQQWRLIPVGAASPSSFCFFSGSCPQFIRE